MPNEGLDPSTQKWSASLDEIRTALPQPGQSDERTWRTGDLARFLVNTSSSDEGTIPLCARSSWLKG
jgi:hypothetical protein